MSLHEWNWQQGVYEEAPGLWPVSPGSIVPHAGPVDMGALVSTTAGSIYLRRPNLTSFLLLSFQILIWVKVTPPPTEYRVTFLLRVDSDTDPPNDVQVAGAVEALQTVRATWDDVTGEGKVEVGAASSSFVDESGLSATWITEFIQGDAVGFLNDTIGAFKLYSMLSDGDLVEKDDLNTPPLDTTFWTKLYDHATIQNGRLELLSADPLNGLAEVEHTSAVATGPGGKILKVAHDRLGRRIFALGRSNQVYYSAKPIGQYVAWSNTGLSGNGVAVETLSTGRTKIHVGSSGAEFDVPE